MRLVDLTICGLKHADETTYRFDGPTAIYGANQTGKSTIREALELLALGYSPPLGKTNGATMTLAPAGCDLLSVSATFDVDGRRVRLERSWHRSGKSVATSARATGARDKRSAESMIELMLGNISPVLDVAPFVGMTPDKRREYLFSHAGHRSKLTVADIRERLAKIGVTPLPDDGHTADTYTALAYAAAVAEQKELNARLRELKSVIADLEARLALVDVEGDPDGSGNEALKRLEAQRDDLATSVRDVERIQRERIRLGDELAHHEQRKARLDEQTLSSPVLDDVDERIAAAVARIARIDTDLLAVDAEISAHSTVLVATETRVGELRAVITSNQAIVHRGTTCPLCGSAIGVLFVELAEAELLEQHEELGLLLAGALERREVCDALDARGRDLQRGRAAQQAEIASLDAAQQTASMRETLVAEAEDATREIATVRVRLGALTPATESSAPDRLATLERQIAEAKAAVGEVASMRDRLTRRKRELDQVGADLAKTKAAIACLGPRGVQGEIASEILVPFAAAANRLVEAAQLGRLDFVSESAGKPVCDVLLVRDGLPPSPLDTLSGGERAVVLAALSTGFGEVCESRWTPALIDNVERLDFSRRAEFLRSLAELQAGGLVDNAIVLGCPDRPEVPDGWTVISPTDTADTSAGAGRERFSSPNR